MEVHKLQLIGIIIVYNINTYDIYKCYRGIKFRTHVLILTFPTSVLSLIL